MRHFGNFMIEQISKKTIHLISHNIDKTSFSPRSGFILAFQEEFYLCTAAHNLDEKNFFLNILSDSQLTNQIDTQKLQNPQLLAKLSIDDFSSPEELVNLLLNFNSEDPRVEKVDFAYLNVTEFVEKDKENPTINIFQKKLKLDSIVIDEGPKQIIYENEIISPVGDDSYGCFGRIYQNKNGEKIHYKYIENIKFSFSDGDYDYFEIPEDIEDDNNFIGISGSPILNKRGNLVGLVKGKGGTKFMLKSVPIRNLLFVLDIENQQNNKR